jgi:hypothetical protein
MLAERINGRVICGYFPFGGRNNGSTARPHQLLGYAINGPGSRTPGICVKGGREKGLNIQGTSQWAAAER